MCSQVLVGQQRLYQSVLLDTQRPVASGRVSWLNQPPALSDAQSSVPSDNYLAQLAVLITFSEPVVPTNKQVRCHDEFFAQMALRAPL